MKKFKMIKYDERYLYATDECMEYNATKEKLMSMLSAMFRGLIKKGSLTKEEMNLIIELASLEEDELDKRVTEAISNLFEGVSKALKEEKPKKKTTKKEGNK